MPRPTGLFLPLLLLLAAPLAGAQEPLERSKAAVISRLPSAFWPVTLPQIHPSDVAVEHLAQQDSANDRMRSRRNASAEQSEEFSRFFYVALAAGANWPVGDMNVSFDPSFLFLGRVEYALTPSIRAGGQLSFHSFDAELPGIWDNRGVINLSLIGKAYGKWGPYKPFGLFGLGAYWSKQEDSKRRLDGGVQIGAGFELPTNNYLGVTAGTGLHLVFRGDQLEDLLWLDAYVGFVFREP